MVMLDRRKLAVPLFAQAGAFVAVLVIGGFTGQSAPKAPAPGSGLTSGPAATATASPTASSTVSASTGTKEQASMKLSVKVTKQGEGLSIVGSPVKVQTDTGTVRDVASGTLDQSLQYAVNVPAGTYQVCVTPPPGWGSSVNSAQAPPGSVCTDADLRKGPAVVTFHLAPEFQGGQ